ncbi:MAG: glycoside hydrolase family 15 protein [Desulfomonilaceae bacterium]
MPIIHNQTISNLIRDSYSLEDLTNLLTVLREKGAFVFTALDNGLFPAADVSRETEYTGYGNVWIRDNIYVDYAHYLNDQTSTATQNIKTLLRYFIEHKRKLEQIIAGKLPYNEPMNRPHVRFRSSGKEFTEIDQKWSHAQNDALGYFLWFVLKLCLEKHIDLTLLEKELLAIFALYFRAIRYWEDEDSGHWEETRKREASSIGVVVGALVEFKALLQKEGNEGFNYHGDNVTSYFLDDLIAKGRNSLQEILPAECIQSEPNKHRLYDAALLFLIFPMKVVEGGMADQILRNVTNHLQGDYGIRRYLGDSFWSADYKNKLKPEERYIDFSDNISVRDSLLRPGQEAQWCIFDPIMSIIYGQKYQRYHRKEYLQQQVYYFNRSLGQLTGEDSPFGAFRCPELYYLEKGQYVPNDTVPLLWTQANLWMAFKIMKDSLQ